MLGRELIFPNRGNTSIAFVFNKYWHLKSLDAIVFTKNITCSKRETMTLEERRYHVVKKGETLWLIAKRYGIPVQLLYALNPRIDATKLKVGQRIDIP